MQDLLYNTIDIALQAGKIVMSFYNKNINIDIKFDKTPITQADIESNNFIIDSLLNISPYKICSEEAILEYEIRKDLDYYWLIDPLDGTKDFIEKKGGFTINIALINNNYPILGVVYAPYFNELYFALKNYGAYTIDKKYLLTQKKIFDKKYLIKNQEKLNGKRKIKDKSIIACDSVFHSTTKTKEFLLKYNLKTIKQGSSLKFCSLANGKADIYPRFNGTKEWDIAASDIILRESKGIIIDYITKKPIEYNKENMKNNYFIAFAKSQINGDIWKDLKITFH